MNLVHGANLRGEPVQGIGSGWLSAVHPDDTQRARKIWLKAVADGSAFKTDLRVRRSDGQWRYINVRGVPVRNETGSVVEWLGLCRDITNRVNYEELLEQERRFADAIIECLPGIFYVVDADGNLLRWNETSEALSGYAPAELMGRIGADFFTPEDRPNLIELRKRIIDNGSYEQMEATFVAKSGQHIPCLINGRRVHLDNKPCVIGLALDISKLKQVEAQLRHLNATLEQRIEQRTQELQLMNKELEAFSYTVSHDLQAPLRAITGFTEMLEEDYGKTMPSEAVTLLHRIQDAGERMSHLIQDLLCYSRIGRSAVTLQSVSMTELLRQIASEFQLHIQQIGGRLQLPDTLPTVRGEPTLLTGIFTNLFENAINYRREDVPLLLCVTAETKDERILFCVSDNGIGIPSESQEKLFQPFTRLHTQSECPGTGLGLAIVRKSVETMGGRVCMESEVGKGSKFYVELAAV